MHEVEPTNSEIFDLVKEYNEKVDILNETVMACLVQLSRIYDIMAIEHYAKRSKYGPEASELLQGHEQGNIHTTAPVLRSFGEPEDDDEETDSSGS